MSQRMQRTIKRTLVALVAVLGAVVVRAFCHSVFNETIPYTPFYAATVIATMYGRLPGGLIATVMAGGNRSHPEGLSGGNWSSRG
ncbi:MAG: hypothetical protein WD872_08945, partial [Pirellulaceae bacterium]